MSVIKASELKPGHNVVTLDNQIHRVRNVSRGWWINSVMIHWSGGWACVREDDVIESPEQEAKCESASPATETATPTNRS